MIPDSIFPALLNQLIQVSCVAVLAVLVTRWTRGTRPHFVHAIWLIVLLKCVTPPVVSSPTSPFSWFQAIVNSEDQQHGARTMQIWNREPENRASANAALRTDIVKVPTSELGGNSVERWSFDWIATCRSLSRIASRYSSIQLLLLSWLTIGGVIFAIIVFRFLRFLKLVRRTRICDANRREYSPRLNRLVAKTESKLGMRRRTRVEVVNALLGPAIVGIFRPTILLPKVIVDTTSDIHLETLIAHELVHFRRGDLWWSALQALAVCCYWFHPLIWVARSVMNREAEKCCDEETIGSLKCNPGEYAQCLISVLECKHMLRAAPLLPGVRPVDITAKRLERIMRLRHGCYSQCPRWVRITLVIGALVLLPGAALTIAQQDGDTARAAKTYVRARLPQAASDRTVLPVLLDTKVSEKAACQLESFDVTDVLSKLVNTESVSPEQAVAKLLARLPSHNSQAELVVEIEGSQNAVKLGGDHPSIQVIGNRLYALGTEKERSSIRTYLEHYRHIGNRILVYEVQILDVPTKNLDALAIRWDSEQNTNVANDSNESNVVTATFESAPITNKMAQLDSSQMKELLACEDCKILTRPTITSLNAQSAQVHVGSMHPFVAGHTALKGEDGKPTNTFQPKISFVEAGIKLELEGSVIANDPSKLAVRLKLTQSKIIDVGTVTYEENGKELSIQAPNVRQRSIQTQVEQLLGSTFALAGTPEKVETVTESRVPFLSDLPYVGATFKNVAKQSELRTLVVLVSGRLVDAAEVLTSAGTRSSTNPIPVSSTLR